MSICFSSDRSATRRLPVAGFFMLLCIFLAAVAHNFWLPIGCLMVSVTLGYWYFKDYLTGPYKIAVSDFYQLRLCAFTVSDWLSFQQAAERYCDPAFVKMRKDAASEVNSIILNLVSAAGMRSTGSTSSVGHGLQEAAQIKIKHATQALVAELLEKLRKGELLAKGELKLPDKTASARIIPPAQWHTLKIDFAVGTAHNEHYSYTGVVVGKPGKRAQINNRTSNLLPPATKASKRLTRAKHLDDAQLSSRS